MSCPRRAHRTSPSGVPEPRLVCTKHDAEGKSVFASDSTITPFKPFGPLGSAFTIFDSRSSIPVRNTDDVNHTDFANVLPRCPPGGVMFCTSDFPPGGKAPMHRTLSLDYAVVMSGEITLILDGGEEKTVGTGEFIVQQGVDHAWENRGTVPCRLLFVMVGAEKVRLQGGTELEPTVFGPKE